MVTLYSLSNTELSIAQTISVNPTGRRIGSPETEIEVTSEMIEAGRAMLYEFNFTYPMDGEMRDTIRAVFLAML